LPIVYSRPPRRYTPAIAWPAGDDRAAVLGEERSDDVVVVHDLLAYRLEQGQVHRVGAVLCRCKNG